MEVKDIIKSRRQELHLTMKQIADYVGVNEGTVSRWESGEIANMRRDKIMLLAKALNISPAVIMEWDLDNESGGHSKPIPDFPNIRPIAKRRLPVLSSIACGEPILRTEELEVYVDITTDVQADYVLIAKGDSMEGARIHDGDLIFIRQQPTVENGEIAAVAIGDDATLKRVYWYAGKTLLVLRAENPAYKDMEFSGKELEDIRILGKAVAFQSDVR